MRWEGNVREGRYMSIGLSSIPTTSHLKLSETQECRNASSEPCACMGGEVEIEYLFLVCKALARNGNKNLPEYPSPPVPNVFLAGFKSTVKA